ncbi:hypothetical protein HYW42_05695 [Candidatus Daviesbacteria bacterium]|nr:hypothetical protein [Candidatus Daviesbacteria bacterium]
MSFDNIDETTKREGEELQRKLGVRWVARDWAAFRVSKFTARDKVVQQEKLKNLQPVNMPDRNQQVWARKLGSVNDSQASRINERIHDASAEARRFELEQKKWDQQAQEVLKDSKWGG